MNYNEPVFVSYVRTSWPSETSTNRFWKSFDLILYGPYFFLTEQEWKEVGKLRRNSSYVPTTWIIL